MRSREYGPDLSRPKRAPVPTVAADPGLVVEEAATGWCGAVVECDKERVSLEDRHGKVRVFPLDPAGFLLEGVPVTLSRPVVAPVRKARTASGSVAVAGVRARVARGSRIWVEGKHDAQLVERVWGDDLRIEGVVVEALDGVDDLPAEVAAFRPGRDRRLGVLVDHLVPGSKESRVVAQVRDPDVLVTGHPYVDVWQAVKPAAVGIATWPVVPPGRPWKEGVCAALGWGDPREGWRRVLAAVDTYTDLEVPLLQSVERLIDFVTAE
ncbi:MAG: DUF3097 domain-containing protein [Actinobacteria bacterium]|nr:DUF3097 domain-containing protein [Actinomycetota bacterium]MCA1722127.1 DUF3097 domain-containing protein [Actinomycetota bacterium]